MGKRIEIIDQIKASTGGSVLLLNRLTYATNYSLDDLGDEDIVPKKMLGGFTKSTIARAIFTNETDILIDNYQGAYAAIYGNAPMLDIYLKNADGTYTQDRGTPATLSFVDADIEAGVDTISYTYPVPVSGFILIAGTPDPSVSEAPIEIT